MELSRASFSSLSRPKLSDLSRAAGVVDHTESKPEADRTERKRAAYAYLKEHFKVTKFILQSGQKLRLQPVAIATACMLYHRFWRQYLQIESSGKEDFDNYMIGTTVLYIASKVEESPRKLRDVINVCHRSLHNDRFLDVGREFWELRDSLVSCELFVLRVLAFRVATDNPHKYLLHYLKSLQGWVEPETWQISNISQVCWSILCDSVHITLTLDHPSPHVAIAVIFFAVLCTGMQIPSQGAKRSWWKAMCDTTSIDEVQDIIGDLMDLYDYESKPLL